MLIISGKNPHPLALNDSLKQVNKNKSIRFLLVFRKDNQGEGLFGGKVR